MRYSEEDEQFLRENYQTMTHAAIADRLNRTAEAVGKRLNLMGLKKNTKEAAPHINTVEGRKYWRIVVGNKKPYVHKLNYEAKYGKVPHGFMLCCKDGDTLNADADNWELISKADRMRGNCNPEGTSAGMKKLWAKVKLREAYGRPVNFCKYRSRVKQRAAVVSIPTEPTKNISF